VLAWQINALFIPFTYFCPKWLQKDKKRFQVKKIYARNQIWAEQIWFDGSGGMASKKKNIHAVVFSGE
jgi:hypothetical protein